MIKLRCLIIITCSLFSLLACKDEPPAPPAPPAKKAVAAKPPEIKDDKPAEAAPPKYVYNVLGRRDPFLPLMLVKKPVAPKGEEIPLTPLQQYEIDQFRLTGVIIGKGEPVAMVIAPDNKAYILKKGIHIGKNAGTVIKIISDTVFVKEKYQDFSGEVRENILEIQLPKRGGA